MVAQNLHGSLRITKATEAMLFELSLTTCRLRFSTTICLKKSVIRLAIATKKSLVGHYSVRFFVVLTKNCISLLQPYFGSNLLFSILFEGMRQHPHLHRKVLGITKKPCAKAQMLDMNRS